MPDADWRTLDADALDRAYDNRGAVADSASRLAGWRARSAVLRAERPGTLDIPYGPRPRNRIDLFEGDGGNAPLLAFVHGGYWQRNAREDFGCMALGPLALGLDVALIGYTLAPEATLSEIADEIGAALRLLRARDEAAGRPRRRLVASGWSAGGHLAALSCQWPEVDAALCISGIYDLAPIRRTGLNEALRLTEDEVATLSPMRLGGRRGVPVTVAYGLCELPELQRQSRDYAALRQASGEPGGLLPLAAHDHFSILDAMIAPDGALAQAALALARG
ncbi:hypothetical protein ASG40_02945 [Methylobacterium sp. Leaf399]|uniref:alpha/beta hydrolase n=1 Tax=Methylobacterium sp. Leaf399 TaxID=1736364 RepID=UPI0006FD118C|nr:alpha/beta hydrolase [Methylobacterium sp. Leaf399]KQT19792.1 hypothetical protein ASG40_02945 [Methylobacterium sp. Leaf399]